MSSRTRARQLYRYGVYQPTIQSTIQDFDGMEAIRDACAQAPTALPAPARVRLTRKKCRYSDEESAIRADVPKSSWPKTESYSIGGHPPPLTFPSTTQLSIQCLPKIRIHVVDETEALENEYVRSFFGRIVENTPCTFVCVGRPEKCRIAQVKLEDDDDSVVIFRKMRETWENKLRKRLPFRRVSRVEEVTVCGMNNNSTSNPRRR